MQKITASVHRCPYRIGETNETQLILKKDTLFKLLNPYAATFREAFAAAKPTQFVEVDLPKELFVYMYEQEPTDMHSVNSLEFTLINWVRSQILCFNVKLYLDVVTKSADTSANWQVSTIHPTARQGINCLDFRFYCYFVKPLNA